MTVECVLSQSADIVETSEPVSIDHCAEFVATVLSVPSQPALFVETIVYVFSQFAERRVTSEPDPPVPQAALFALTVECVLSQSPLFASTVVKVFSQSPDSKVISVC